MEMLLAYGFLLHLKYNMKSNRFYTCANNRVINGVEVNNRTRSLLLKDPRGGNATYIQLLNYNIHFFFPSLLR